MNLYEPYFLKDNPFPITPILDPSSDDDRVNGKIYDPHIRESEISSFGNKICQRPPLIYIVNSDFVLGVGKSALLVQQWRQLQSQPDVTSIYLRSQEKFKPADFAARVIERWHYEGNLWPTVLKVLEAYVKENLQGEISSAGLSLFKEKLPKLPSRPIALTNFNVFNPKRLINDLATFAHKKAGDNLSFEVAKLFFETYLANPAEFLRNYPNTLRKQKMDTIGMLSGIYRLLKLGGYDYHYLFFDQFEDVVQGLTAKALTTFNTEMRRLIEASMGQATITVTLHPGAVLALRSQEGGDIRSIAPLDSRHMVEVRPLTEDGVHKLMLTYLDHYRLGNATPPDPLYPFSPETVAEMRTASDGNIRNCLKALNLAMVRGMDAGYVILDKSFLIQYHSEITGQIHPEKIDL